MQHAVPMLTAAEEMTPGVANFYATTCRGCASACSLVVKQRDGRPIKIEGNELSSLFGGTWPDGPEVSIRFGALDGDPGIRPQYHSHTASAATWDTILADGLPRHPGAAPGA